jgi:hypothetical protein
MTTILLPALAVAFAAFCVWLVVRIVNRRELWAKRAATWMLVGMPSLYLIGFGPACWWLSELWVSQPAPSFTFRSAPRIYAPMGWIIQRVPKPVGSAIGSYATLMIAPRDMIFLGSLDGEVGLVLYSGMHWE